ncbi:MAG: hypothetical protein KC486_34720, partial [Myxococcales bacterium]|nr:hypothetical protein [Myxococcales bacterium]
MQQGKSTEGSYWRRAAVRIAAISSWSMLLWGSWALAANLSYGVEAAARAGLTQGASSLTLTCLQTAILEAVSRRCAGPAAKVIAPTLCASLIHALLTIAAHTAAGTPALLAAVGPNIAASVAYSLTYAAGLALAAHPELRILQRLVQISQGLRRRPAAIARASARVSLSAPAL